VGVVGDGNVGEEMIQNHQLKVMDQMVFRSFKSPI